VGGRGGEGNGKKVVFIIQKGYPVGFDRLILILNRGRLNSFGFIWKDGRCPYVTDLIALWGKGIDRL
jgi:hypothetical protein